MAKNLGIFVEIDDLAQGIILGQQSIEIALDLSLLFSLCLGNQHLVALPNTSRL